MKWMIAILFYLSASVWGFGQKYFQLQSTIGSFDIILNGKIHTIDSNFKKLPTRFPQFDTLRFRNETWSDETAFICNFKPDSSYSCITACCGTTDIIQSWKLQNDSVRFWDLELDFDKIQRLFMDRPSFTLKIKNGTSKDSIYAWYCDHACFPSFKLIDKNGWEYGTPAKCFYWSNMSMFEFFKSKEDYSKDINQYGIVEDVFPDGSQRLGYIFVRLFDDEKFTITYDVKKKNIRLEYDRTN